MRPASYICVVEYAHTIEDHIPCHATVVCSTNLLKAEESQRLDDVLCIGESVQCMHRLLYVLDNNAAPHNTSRRTAAGRLIALCTYLELWRGTARGLRWFRTCTIRRMQLKGRNVPCKQYCTRGLQQQCHEKGLDAFRFFFKQCHEEVLSLQPMIPPKYWDTSPLTMGYLEGLDAFIFFYK